MKRYVFFIALLSAFIFSSCKKDDVKNFKIDTDKPLNIKEAKTLRAEDTEQTLSWADIVRKEYVFLGFTNSNGSTPLGGIFFVDGNKDKQNNILKLGSWLVINLKGGGIPYLDTDFLNTYDLYIYTKKSLGDNTRDTVAYIPNKNRIAIRAELERLWEQKDSEAIYKLFEEGYRAVRCTGKEFREMKEKGLN